MLSTWLRNLCKNKSLPLKWYKNDKCNYNETKAFWGYSTHVVALWSVHAHRLENQHHLPNSEWIEREIPNTFDIFQYFQLKVSHPCESCGKRISLSPISHHWGPCVVHVSRCEKHAHQPPRKRLFFNGRSACSNGIGCISLEMMASFSSLSAAISVCVHCDAGVLVLSPFCRALIAEYTDQQTFATDTYCCCVLLCCVM